MRKSHKMFVLALVVATAAPVVAQQAAAPAFKPVPVAGTPDVSRVVAGTYTADGHHSQIAWTINHLGLSIYRGLIGEVAGTMTLDPANPSAASVSMTIPINAMITTLPALTEHLLKPDFFDVAAFPTATFKSTGVVVSGTTAQITGNLTLRGVTRLVVLDAHFVGAGINPLTKHPTVGFDATTSIKRSDFGILYGLPGVNDQVDLQIAVAFERPVS